MSLQMYGRHCEKFFIISKILLQVYGCSTVWPFKLFNSFVNAGHGFPWTNCFVIVVINRAKSGVYKKCARPAAAMWRTTYQNKGSQKWSLIFPRNCAVLSIWYLFGPFTPFRSDIPYYVMNDKGQNAAQLNILACIAPCTATKSLLFAVITVVFLWYRNSFMAFPTSWNNMVLQLETSQINERERLPLIRAFIEERKTEYYKIFEWAL